MTGRPNARIEELTSHGAGSWLRRHHAAVCPPVFYPQTRQGSAEDHAPRGAPRAVRPFTQRAVLTYPAVALEAGWSDSGPQFGLPPHRLLHPPTDAPIGAVLNCAPRSREQGQRRAVHPHRQAVLNYAPGHALSVADDPTPSLASRCEPLRENAERECGTYTLVAYMPGRGQHRVLPAPVTQAGRGQHRGAFRSSLDVGSKRAVVGSMCLPLPRTPTARTTNDTDGTFLIRPWSAPGAFRS